MRLVKIDWIPPKVKRRNRQRGEIDENGILRCKKCHKQLECTVVLFGKSYDVPCVCDCDKDSPDTPETNVKIPLNNPSSSIRFRGAYYGDEEGRPRCALCHQLMRRQELYDEDRDCNTILYWCDCSKDATVL